MKKLIPLIFALALLAACGMEPAAYYLAEPFGERAAAGRASPSATGGRQRGLSSAKTTRYIR